MNAKRTARGYARAGFAGMLMEDQVAPKACGHTRNRRVLPRNDAVARVKAACDERDEGPAGDICIFARSDARSAESLDEALWRAAAFADVGADALFIDALRSREEMERFCAIAPGVPKMANMLEGGGSTPICTPKELEEMGFKIVAYPLSLLATTARAMERLRAAPPDHGHGRGLSPRRDAPSDAGQALGAGFPPPNPAATWTKPLPHEHRQIGNLAPASMEE